jgi:hypothetical protein
MLPVCTKDGDSRKEQHPGQTHCRRRHTMNPWYIFLWLRRTLRVFDLSRR